MVVRLHRGDVVLVELDPAVSPEQGKVRPCVVVSHDDLNEASHRLGYGMVTLVPLTSNTARVFSFQALIDPASSGLRVPSKAQAEQIRSVSLARVTAVIASLNREDMEAVDEAIRVHLSL